MSDLSVLTQTDETLCDGPVLLPRGGGGPIVGRQLIELLTGAAETRAVWDNENAEHVFQVRGICRRDAPCWTVVVPGVHTRCLWPFGGARSNLLSRLLMGPCSFHPGSESEAETVSCFIYMAGFLFSVHFHGS